MTEPKISDATITQLTVQLTDQMVMKASQEMAKIRDYWGVNLPAEAQIMMAVNAARAVVWAINHPEEAPTQLTYGEIERDESKTMVILQDHTSGGGYATAMPYPEPDVRKAWNVGDHRLVRAWPAGDPPSEWLCFDHGWECPMTKIAASSPPPA